MSYLSIDNSISIHALLAESDYMPFRVPTGGLLFLSTLSLRRATLMVGKPATNSLYFYPRSPCGERPITFCLHMRPVVFLSTLSLRRATYTAIVFAPPIPEFLSTLSLRRATRAVQSGNKVNHNFYPRSPCGERLTSVLPTIPAPAISIHALLAESDHRIHRQFPRQSRISIHALLAESDP